MTAKDCLGRLLWTLASYGLALLLAGLVTAAIVVVLGHSPAEAIRAALKDSLGTLGGFGQVLNRMTPLLLASLAFALGQLGGVANIGIDGQIYAGGIAATWVGFLLAGSGLSAWAGVPLVLVAGMVGGGLWVMAPGLLRVRWGVNEIFSTVMFNFVALYLAEYLCTGPWNDPASGEAITYPIARSGVLPMLIARGGAHAGIIVACAVALSLWWVLYRTVPGYELRAAGANPRAARIGGIPVARMQFLALVVGGVLAGLAGAIEVSGVHKRLMLGLSPGYGFMGILIAVLARHHPIALIPANFALAVLIAGSDSLQRTVGFPAAAVFMLQALIVLIVLGVDAVRQRRERFVI